MNYAWYLLLAAPFQQNLFATCILEVCSSVSRQLTSSEIVPGIKYLKQRGNY